MYKRIISFKKLPYPHTRFVIEDAIEKCLVEWKLDSKICATTLDNCMINDIVIRKVQDHFSNRMLFDGEYIDISCAHILNMMV